MASKSGYRTMTHKKLMERIADGAVEVNAWCDENDYTLADVTIWKSNGTGRREVVEVTGIPTEEE